MKDLRKCRMCATRIGKKHGNSIYCESCSEKRKGRKGNCLDCGKTIYKKRTTAIYCTSCGNIRKQNNSELWKSVY